MTKLIIFILSILAWLASLFGSEIQPRNEAGYPAPYATPNPANAAPESTPSVWQHYGP